MSGRNESGANKNNNDDLEMTNYDILLSAGSGGKEWAQKKMNPPEISRVGSGVLRDEFRVRVARSKMTQIFAFKNWAEFNAQDLDIKFGQIFSYCFLEGSFCCVP